MILIGNVEAQQDAQFSHYMFNNLYSHPGYTGIEKLTRLTLLHRSQWVGYDGVDEGTAPTTQLLSFDYPLKIGSGVSETNSGAGAFLMHDQLGPLRIINAEVSFAYHIPFRLGGKIGVGLRTGVVSQRIDGSLLRAVDNNDPIVQGLSMDNNSQTKADLSLGGWYESKKIFGGVTINHILRPLFEYDIDADSIESKYSRHMYITAGYNYQLTGNILLTPTGHLQTDFNNTSFNLGARGSYDTKGKYEYWAGIQTRNSLVSKDIQEGGKKMAVDDVYLLLGVGMLPNTNSQYRLRIGYAFDLVTTGRDAKQSTSHEIMVSYVLPVGPEFKPPPKRTPRYRHEN